MCVRVWRAERGVCVCVEGAAGHCMASCCEIHNSTSYNLFRLFRLCIELSVGVASVCVCVCVCVSCVSHASLIPRYEWLPAFDDSHHSQVTSNA